MKPTHQEFFATTIDYPDYPAFLTRGKIITPGKGNPLTTKFYLVRDILKSARAVKGIILDSTSHSDLFACIILGFSNKAHLPVIVMVGDMWQKDAGLAGFIQKAVLRLADRAIFRYAPLSSEEFPFFEQAWGISREKLRTLPYFYTFTSRDLSEPEPPQEEFIFSGGNAHRDYLPLVKAMEHLPEYKLFIGSHLLNKVALPPNVKAGQLPRPEFIRKMRASRAVIVPIVDKLFRSTGHQTYLNGMMLGKPTIVNNVLGVREYTQNGSNSIIVDGSVEGYVHAIRKVMNPANRVEMETLGKAAQEAVKKDYTFEKHCEGMLDIFDEAVEDYYK